MSVAPIVLCAIAVPVMLVARWRGRPVAAALAKMFAASAFLWAALAWGALDSAYGLTLFTGLSLCWLGDLFLVPRGTTMWFRLGMGAFLSAHLVYALAFMQLPIATITLAIAVLAWIIATWLILKWLWPHLSLTLRWSVSAYVVTIGVMNSIAFGATAGGAAPAVALGALTFAISDLAVARDRFVKSGLRNKVWGQPLYFAAQLMIASTVLPGSA